MEPETQFNLPDSPVANSAKPPSENDDLFSASQRPQVVLSTPPAPGLLQQVFIGDQGLRAGWSIAIFLILFILIAGVTGLIFTALHLSMPSGHVTARGALFGEVIAIVGLLGAVSIVALIERRRILDFNLAGPRRTSSFFSGLAAGFLALSVLVCELWSGGWLHFGPTALSGSAVAKYAALWGLTFLLVGFFEEGVFRCYLQFTLSRALNFWWAIGIQALVCCSLALRSKGSAAWGVYGIVLLGLVPCLMLYLKHAPRENFWHAAWVTSTLFGYVHVGNNGENWIGIFAAAAIGFVFCVSVWLTGSAWWAIGCHAGWDWGETYFYGTADSGMVAQGHYFSTSPFGNAFWSGGTNGPEGSFLVLGVILLLLLALLVIYRPRRIAESAQSQYGG
jgi:membrane protease YdiL (CAAX protease family)